jgi:hypothetical protein
VTVASVTTLVEPAVAPLRRSPLRVGAVDDPAEVEAEAVADRVMRIPSPAPTLIQRCPGGCPDEEAVRRRPVDGDEDEELLRQPADGDEEELQLRRDPAGTGSPPVTAGVAAAIGSQRGGGASLPGGLRRFFEPRFGVDLSSVRVHHDTAAAGLAASVRARAFTVGTDVFFGSGEWAPGTMQGDQLLAHELTHTVQQTGRNSDRGHGSPSRR